MTWESTAAEQPGALWVRELTWVANDLAVPLRFDKEPCYSLGNYLIWFLKKSHKAYFITSVLYNLPCNIKYYNSETREGSQSGKCVSPVLKPHFFSQGFPGPPYLYFYDAATPSPLISQPLLSPSWLVSWPSKVEKPWKQRLLCLIQNRRPRHRLETDGEMTSCLYQCSRNKLSVHNIILNSVLSLAI